LFQFANQKTKQDFFSHTQKLRVTAYEFLSIKVFHHMLAIMKKKQL